MTTLIDTSLWIDFTRAKSTHKMRQFVAPFIAHPAAHLAEPIVFEMLRHAAPSERRQLVVQFHTLPMLPTPGDIWIRATKLGQACRDRGQTIGALDLLIASVALASQAIVVTFDEDFQKIADASALRVKLLQRLP